MITMLTTDMLTAHITAFRKVCVHAHMSHFRVFKGHIMLLGFPISPWYVLCYFWACWTSAKLKSPMSYFLSTLSALLNSLRGQYVIAGFSHFSSFHHHKTLNVWYHTWSHAELSWATVIVWLGHLIGLPSMSQYTCIEKNWVIDRSLSMSGLVVVV